MLQVASEGALGTPSGRRYDPAAPLLGALAAPPPQLARRPAAPRHPSGGPGAFATKPSTSDCVHLPGVSLLTCRHGTAGMRHPVPALMMRVHAVV